MAARSISTKHLKKCSIIRFRPHLSRCCLNTFAVVAKLEGYLSPPDPAPFDAVAYTARDSMEHRNIPYLVALGWREELELY